MRYGLCASKSTFHYRGIVRRVSIKVIHRGSVRFFLFFKIPLMILLRAIELPHRKNLRHNRRGILPRCVKFPFYAFGDFFLALGCVENSRAILFSHIRSLPVRGCRVVHFKKGVNERVVGNKRGVIRNFCHFSMPRFSRANLLVGRRRHLPAAVADDDGDNTFHFSEDFFNMPEAPGAEEGFFDCSHVSILPHLPVVTNKEDGACGEKTRPEEKERPAIAAENSAEHDRAQKREKKVGEEPADEKRFPFPFFVKDNREEEKNPAEKDRGKESDKKNHNNRDDERSEGLAKRFAECVSYALYE